MEEKQDHRKVNRRPASKKADEAATRKPSSASKAIRRKRKKKQRAPGIKTRKLWRNLLIVVAVSVAVVLTMIVFFRVDCDSSNGALTDAWYDAHVNGNVHYSAQKIWQASGIEDGDNLLVLSREQVAARIMARLPYVKDVKVDKKLPNQVILTVSEHEISYEILDETGQYWLMTAEGKLLEQIDSKQAREHLQITGFKIRTAQEGASAQAGEGASPTQLDATVQLLRALEATEISDKVVSVDVPASYELSFWYQDQYHVLLGTTDELDYKLRYLEQVIAELDSYTTGEIDLTFSKEKTAIFRSE